MKYLQYFTMFLLLVVILDTAKSEASEHKRVKRGKVKKLLAGAALLGGGAYVANKFSDHKKDKYHGGYNGGYDGGNRGGLVPGSPGYGGFNQPGDNRGGLVPGSPGYGAPGGNNGFGGNNPQVVYGGQGGYPYGGYPQGGYGSNAYGGNPQGGFGPNPNGGNPQGGFGPNPNGSNPQPGFVVPGGNPYGGNPQVGYGGPGVYPQLPQRAY